MIVTKSDPYQGNTSNEIQDKQIISALAMDLKRMALGLHRGSFAMATRFMEEATRRIEEVDKSNLLPYMKNVLVKIQYTLSIQDKDKKAEDFLMYSTILQNYVLNKQ